MVSNLTAQTIFYLNKRILGELSKAGKEWISRYGGAVNFFLKAYVTDPIILEETSKIDCLSKTSAETFVQFADVSPVEERYP